MADTVSPLLSKIVRSCRGWDDFRRHLSGLSAKDKGDAFEHLVKAYLLLEPEYATKLRNVWLLDEIPQDTVRKLKLPASDQGIDLVAETHEGGFWAIQCKYREDTEHALTWRELSTFTGLAFGASYSFVYGLVCSTTERITHVLRENDRVGFCALDVWQALDGEFFDRLRRHAGKRPDKLQPLKPRPHQRDAIRDALAHFTAKDGQRGKLIMPCGTGKSLTAYWIAKELGTKRVLVAVPSLALIRQTLKVWLRESMADGRSIEWNCVCSDESAGRMDSDDIAVLRQDIGVPCITDAGEIASWLKKTGDGFSVVFTTYQSGEAIAAAARNAGHTFDLGIMDEAHKTVGAKDKAFAHLLDDSNISIRRRLFMTATERRYKGQSDEILSMENPETYGDTFHQLSFKRALEYDPPILSDYKIVTMLVSRAEVAELVRENIFIRPEGERWNTEIEARMLASMVALRKAMRRYPIRHAVTFHSSVRRARLFCVHNDAFGELFPNYSGVETFHVSGATPTGTRARTLKEFEQSRKAIITNARCLTEGVDVPDIDCVLFADPRRSTVDIVQAVGRALRPAPGKKFGYVIVPLLHDADASSEDIFDSEDFQEILTTLRALAANDDRIIEYFRTISQGRRPKGGGSVEFEMDERLAKRMDLADFARQIELKCWDRLAKLSWRPFEEAREFARSLELKSQTDWRALCKGQLPGKGMLPSDIPTNPSKSYAGEGWKGYGDWLGTGTIATRLRKYRPFEEARAFVQSLNLKSGDEWRSFCKLELPEKGRLPSDIPSRPHNTYARSGWKSMGDWLGTSNVATFQRKYRPFSAARRFARSLKLKSIHEWRAFCKGQMPHTHKCNLPADVPASPHKTYADDGWKGFGDWLGTGTIAPFLRTFRSFSKARAFARSLGLKSGGEWSAFCKGQMPSKGKLPSDIPSAPSRTYADHGWTDMGDWLGTGFVAFYKRRYRAFREARAFARSLELTSQTEWRAFCKAQLPNKGRLPSDIPSAPSRTYAGHGWKGYGDWLGTGTIAPRLRKYKSFSKARGFARSLKLKSVSEWSAYCKGQFPSKGKLPVDIPATPYRTYAEQGWNGYGDWLGTGTIVPFMRKYRTFREGRLFARSLNLKSVGEWRAFCKGKLPAKGALPSDISASPHKTYFGKGWKGMGDWLGTGRTRRKGGG